MRGVFLALFLAASLLSAGCVRPGPANPWPTPALNSPLPAAIPSLAVSTTLPSATPIPTTGQPPTSLPADSGWQTLRPALESRTLQVRDETGKNLESIYLLRLDPSAYEFRVAVDAQGRTLENWLSGSGALIAFNGGYYRLDNQDMVPTGLTIVDGQPSGESYGDFAGMLAVSPDGARLRWLAQDPYDPQEGLTYALQSFPLLVKPGGVLGFPAEAEDNQPARRTVIAQDRSGRFVLLLAPRGYFTLHQLSAFLVESDLDLDIALNLDGGPSSGLLLADPAQGETALLPLPIAILVYPR